MTDNESMQSTAPSGSGVAGYESTQSTTVSGSAAAGYVFAGVILILVGCFQAVVGLAAIFDDEFFVVSKNYTFEIDTTAWGWIHLLVGLLVGFAGYALFAAKTWARVVGVTLATLSAIANFFFIPFYPFWAILIIALDVWVIWALTRSIESTDELTA
jgi:hypothetical protein